MPAPTAPDDTTTISLPLLRCSASCVTNCSICARSGCLRLSVSTPVPSFTTMRVASLSNCERTDSLLPNQPKSVEAVVASASGSSKSGRRTAAVQNLSEFTWRQVARSVLDCGCPSAAFVSKAFSDRQFLSHPPSEALDSQHGMNLVPMMEPLEPPDLHFLSAAIGWL